MQMSVYLSEDVIKVLNAYGGIDNAVNHILELCEQGLIDIENKPKPHSRQFDKRVNVNVTNQYYLELLYDTGNSSKISLRRLIYWFVENDMFEVFNVSYNFVNDNIEAETKGLYRMITESIRTLTLAYEKAVELKNPIVENIKDVMRCYNEKLNQFLQNNGEQ